MQRAPPKSMSIVGNRRCHRRLTRTSRRRRPSLFRCLLTSCCQARKIRKLHVNVQQQKALNDASLGIAHLKGRFYLVDAEIISRVKEIKPDAVAFFAPDLPDNPAEDDIPDDLVW